MGVTVYVMAQSVADLVGEVSTCQLAAKTAGEMITKRRKGTRNLQPRQRGRNNTTKRKRGDKVEWRRSKRRERRRRRRSEG